MTAAVVDASSVLAYLRDEPGAGRVAEGVQHGFSLPTVNLAEIVTILSDHGVDVDGLPDELREVGFEPVTVEAADTLLQARVRRIDRSTRPHGARLSLADRLCLAVAMRLELPALTADRAWAELDLPVEVELIR